MGRRMDLRSNAPPSSFALPSNSTANQPRCFLSGIVATRPPAVMAWTAPTGTGPGPDCCTDDLRPLEEPEPLGFGTNAAWGAASSKWSWPRREAGGPSHRLALARAALVVRVLVELHPKPAALHLLQDNSLAAAGRAHADRRARRRARRPAAGSRRPAPRGRPARGRAASTRASWDRRPAAAAAAPPRRPAAARRAPPRRRWATTARRAGTPPATRAAAPAPAPARRRPRPRRTGSPGLPRPAAAPASAAPPPGSRGWPSRISSAGT